MIYNLFISPKLDVTGIKRRLKKKSFTIRGETISTSINDELSAEYMDKYPKLRQDWRERIKQLSEYGIFLEIECPGPIPAAFAVWKMLTEVFGKKEIILCQVSEKMEL